MLLIFFWHIIVFGKMRVSNITNNILKNRYFLKTLEKISEHGTSFSAGAALLLSTTLRPFAINSTPDVEKENKQYAISNSICSGLIKFGIVESVALPVELAIKKIDKNPQIFLKPETVRDLSPRAYKMITQMLKLSVGFLTAIPKSVMTVALIPIIMDKLFKTSKPEIKSSKNINSNPSFTGKFDNLLSRGVSKVINNEWVRKFAIKYEQKDRDIAMHITAATDVLLTGAAAYRTNKSNDIKENRKKALIYNNVIATGITIGGGYTLDRVVKNKTDKFVNHFKHLNAKDSHLSKYVEGINILRPALIFAFIYYGVLPMFSTYMAERIDKYVNSHIEK